MSLFILHELEVVIDDWRHAADGIAAAVIEYLDAHRRGFEALALAPIREAWRSLIREFAQRYVDDLRRREERKNLKRRRAARARCGRR